MPLQVVDQSHSDFFKGHQFFWRDPVYWRNQQLTLKELEDLAEKQLTEERIFKISRVLQGRSDMLAVVLEHIYDRGNVSAVMRSAEAFGFYQMHLIEKKDQRFKVSHRVTRGAEKWMDIQCHKTTQDSIAALKEQGYRVFASSLKAKRPIEDLDWCKKSALILGNEKDGITPEAESLADELFYLPMSGFSQSFNISVAGALCLYHAFQEHRKSSVQPFADDPQKIRWIRANYYHRCLS